MKSLDRKFKIAGIVVFILVVSIVGTKTLSGSFASPLVKAPISVSVLSDGVISSDPVTQTERFSVDVSIVNQGTGVLQISPGLQMQVVDTNGQSYSMTAQYLPAGQVVGGPLQPGATWSQSVDFKLPIGQTPARFIYQQDNNSNPFDIGL